MRTCILIILIPVLFYACKESVPSGIIKPAKMQEVLWDVFRADVLSQQISQRDSTKSIAAENIRLTNKVFSIHKISKDEFEKSYTYYTQHPDIFRGMLDSLNAQKTRMDTIQILSKQKRFAIDTSHK